MEHQKAYFCKILKSKQKSSQRYNFLFVKFFFLARWLALPVPVRDVRASRFRTLDRALSFFAFLFFKKKTPTHALFEQPVHLDAYIERINISSSVFHPFLFLSLFFFLFNASLGSERAVQGSNLGSLFSPHARTFFTFLPKNVFHFCT